MKKRKYRVRVEGGRHFPEMKRGFFSRWQGLTGYGFETMVNAIDECRATEETEQHKELIKKNRYYYDVNV